jgi:hypothetical protein
MDWDGEHAHGWSTKQESDCNRLNGVQKYKLDVSPTEANIWFRADVQRVTSGTEVRGRILGPRNLFTRTVEFASPLRSVKHRQGQDVMLIARTCFPKPGFWDPLTPFLYRVVIELWQDEQRCGMAAFDLGFCTIELGVSGVFVNKKPFFLQGMRCLPKSREETIARRQAGFNLVLAGEGQWHSWIRANAMGFLLMEKVKPSTLTPQYIGLLCQQPCFLGFVLDRELLDRPRSECETLLRTWQDQRLFIGLELDEPPRQSLPNGLSFLACPESLLPALATSPLPKLAMRVSGAASLEMSPLPIPDLQGWIDS